jgi:hypothetical protein
VSPAAFGLVNATIAKEELRGAMTSRKGKRCNTFLMKRFLSVQVHRTYEPFARVVFAYRFCWGLESPGDIEDGKRSKSRKH